MKKTILHLCADIGSDSYYYQNDPKYKVILIGKETGVENYTPTEKIHGIIANPVCTEFSTASGFHKIKDIEKGLEMVRHCQRIIKESTPAWYVIENPANGRLKETLGKPTAIYQPWQYGSSWTKKTALWGNFVMPKPLFNNFKDVPNKYDLYVRPGRGKPALAFMHKSAIHLIPEFEQFKLFIKCDADFRSLCSQGFAKSFYEVNK